MVFQTLISLKLHHRTTVKSLVYSEKHSDLVLSHSLIITTRIMQIKHKTIYLQYHYNYHSSTYLTIAVA